MLNLNFGNENPKYSYIYADACNMNMIKDKEYDIVFSNSVIEHVGKNNQQLFASEVLRVGKKLWIQTPNKYFPIEPHFVFPFFQYLPIKIKKYIAIKWPYSHYCFEGFKKDEILAELDRLNLLSVDEVKVLFDKTQIVFEKYFGIIKSIIVIKNQ